MASCPSCAGIAGTGVPGGCAQDGDGGYHCLSVSHMQHRAVVADTHHDVVAGGQGAAKIALDEVEFADRHTQRAAGPGCYPGLIVRAPGAPYGGDQDAFLRLLYWR